MRNVNTNMADNGADDKGYTIAYKRTVGKPKDNKKTVVAGKHSNGEFWKARQLSSRQKHPVQGKVAPIKKKEAVKDLYKNGNKYNIAQEVQDRERHARTNEKLAMIHVGKYNSKDPYLSGSYLNGRKK